ncbi:TetR/AcrR family transcriptional regulator [Micromonospora avicenniae]|uniref:Transcriptional regulator, TetR family n=1 Tax=Micromonospora avicenniae TaxID=1198245 RepID=A0A1N6VR83_9ACTN|nr:TetR/AcrR family transcriptional regulator [Micromonospora avicenniae]SIQ80372.1 transcriptional regulator, TetR family [Micromonospora avicenniae]
MGASRYHSPRRADAAAATRASILAAGRELFLRKGYAGTTVSEIAEAARVAVPTVYSSAGGKADILAALIEPITRDPAVAETSAAVLRSEDAAEIVALLGGGVRRTLERHWDVIVELFPQSQSEPAAAEVHERILRAYQEAVGVAAGRLAELGALRPGLSRDDALDVLWFYLGQAAWPALVRDRGWSLERAARWLTAQAAAALLPSADPARWEPDAAT